MNKYINQNNKTIININNIYRLKAILINSDNNDNGHYYCFKKDIDDNLWFKFNDEKVF